MTSWSETRLFDPTIQEGPKRANVASQGVVIQVVHEHATSLSPIHSRPILRSQADMSQRPVSSLKQGRAAG